MATGIPDKALMLDATICGTLHFVTRWPDRQGVLPRQYGVHIWEWEIDRHPGGGVAVDGTASLIPDYTAPVPVLIGTVPGTPGVDATYGYFAVPFAYRYQEMTIQPNAGAWVHSAIELDHVVPAAVVVAPMPHQIEEFDAEQEQVVSTSCGVGRIIRGHSVASTGSLGTLARRVGNGTMAEESAESLGRRLLWSFAHPVGLYVTGADLGVTVWDDEIWIQQRALSPRYVVGTVWPVMIITCAQADTEIKFVEIATGSSWTYTTTGLEVATMITPGAGAPAAGLATDPTSSHLITVTVTSVDQADELLIHSAFIWSGDPY
jgi:hypothetical protein